MLHTRAHANPTNARPKQRGMLACIVALVAGMACTATAQESTFEWPEPNAALVELVGAPYLTDDERRQLKVRHGMDDPADLTSPALKARAALGRGAFTDPALQDPAADPLDRADALLVLGDLRGALDLVKGGDSFRALRIAAQAHLDLGEIADAERTLSAALAKLQAARPAEAAELVEAVAALSLLTRVPDFTAREGRNADTDFRALMQLLGDARRLDRFDADAPLSEAAILFEKDNLPEAIQSLTAALSLFPRSARAWALFGAVTCRQFDFKKALEVAQRLDNIAGTENSLFGSLLAAKVRLRQTDPEGAEEVLATAYAAHPMQREVLALRAAAAAAGFKNDLARERLREFDSRFPGSPTALLEIGLALSDRRQYAEAAEYLRKAIERAPAWPEAWTELGLLEVQACNDDSARDVLKTAQKLDPFNTRAANSLKLVTEMAEYTRLESPHFTVRYKPGVDEVLAREMPAILEKIHARVAGNGRGGINFEPERKTTVDLMPDHAWFSVRITGMPAVHTIAASTGPGIAMEAPRSGSGASMGPYDWARVVQHEYTHTVSLARTRNRLPHWFTEAAAVYLEDAPRDDDRCTLLHRAFETDTLFDFDEINIAFVRPAKPSDRGLAYAQGHWMYEFMIERLGADVPLRLMDRYAAGDSEAQAFQSVMGMSREDFLDRFRSYARESLVSWGLTPPEGVPDVRALLKAEAGDDGERPEPTAEMVDRWLAKYPNHPQVLSLKLAIQLDAHQGKADASMIPLLESVAGARPVDSLPRKLLAKLMLESADPVRAIVHLEFLDEREQNSPTYAMELAKRYVAQGDLARATLKAERATQIGPYLAAPRELAASIAIRNKDFATARRHIEALIILEPTREVHRQRLEALERLQSGVQ